MIESFQDYVEQKESEEEIKLSAGNLIVFRNKSIEGKYEGGHASFVSHLLSETPSKKKYSFNNYQVLFNRYITVLIIEESHEYYRYAESLTDGHFFECFPCETCYDFIDGVDYFIQCEENKMVNFEWDINSGVDPVMEYYNDYPDWLLFKSRQVYCKYSRKKVTEYFLDYTFEKNVIAQKRKIMFETNEEKFDKFYSQKKMKKAMRNLLKETELKLKRKR